MKRKTYIPPTGIKVRTNWTGYGRGARAMYHVIDWDDPSAEGYLCGAAGSGDERSQMSLGDFLTRDYITACKKCRKKLARRMGGEVHHFVLNA